MLNINQQQLIQYIAFILILTLFIAKQPSLLKVICRFKSIEFLPLLSFNRF